MTVSAMVLCCHIASGQYYDWGQDPASVKWNRIKTSDGSYIFPRTYDRHAARIVNYMDTVRPYISEGFELGPMKMPVIMHTQNFQSNGLVMLAPKKNRTDRYPFADPVRYAMDEATCHTRIPPQRSV